MLYYICLISAEPGYAIPASSLDELLRAHLEPMATKFHSAYILTQAPNSEMTDVCVVCVCVRAWFVGSYMPRHLPPHRLTAFVW